MMTAMELQLYKDSMDTPMECLANELGSSLPSGLDDAVIVHIAVKKIAMLKRMVLATGVSEALLDACMKE